jgi:hypothetical protein
MAIEGGGGVPFVDDDVEVILIINCDFVSIDGSSTMPVARMKRDEARDASGKWEMASTPTHNIKIVKQAGGGQHNKRGWPTTARGKG